VKLLLGGVRQIGLEVDAVSLCQMLCNRSRMRPGPFVVSRKEVGQTPRLAIVGRDRLDRLIGQKLADQHSADIRSLEASFQAAVDRATASSERNLHEVSERTEKLIDRLLTESNANVTRLVAALSTGKSTAA